MNLTDQLEIPSQVMAREVGDELVILDLVSGSYFGLDAVGTRVWQLIGEGKNLAQTIEVMLAEYEVERAQLESDLLELAEGLTAQGLLSVTRQTG
jgi:hypothetical protein